MSTNPHPPHSPHAALHSAVHAVGRGWRRLAQREMFGLTRHAQAYEGIFGRLALPIYRRIADDVTAAGLPVGALVVDIGTGPGHLPVLIARENPGLRVEALDLSPEMIAEARRHAREVLDTDGAARLSHRVADVAHLPHEDGSVDLVVSSLSLHHWGDADAGLREIRRVLTPGGRAWIYDVRPVLVRAQRRNRAALGCDLTPAFPDAVSGVPARVFRVAVRRLVIRG